jgi:hypothetical protein
MSGAKEKKENSARDNNHQERRLHKIPHTTATFGTWRLRWIRDFILRFSSMRAFLSHD